MPFSEPPYLCGLPSPYYTASHLEWQKKCRAFITKHLTSHAMEWETAETVPEHVWHDFCKANMLLPSLPAPLPVDRLKSLGIHDILGLPVEEFDYFHNAIYTDEMLRSGLAGPSGSLTTGMAFGVPPLYKFGSKELQNRFLPDLLTGKKRACIAITEPGAGSDVANIETTAVKSKDGKTYIINGTKKWITNGIWSELSCMAVRTGGPGAGGLSLMVVPLKGHKGVSMRRLKVSGQISAGTTYIELDDVEVPAENLIGEEGMGMKYIMTNFNHERLTIAIGCVRQARVALSSGMWSFPLMNENAIDLPSTVSVRILSKERSLWKISHGSTCRSTPSRQMRCSSRSTMGMDRRFRVLHGQATKERRRFRARRPHSCR